VIQADLLNVLILRLARLGIPPARRPRLGRKPTLAHGAELGWVEALAAPIGEVLLEAARVEAGRTDGVAAAGIDGGIGQ